MPTSTCVQFPRLDSSAQFRYNCYVAEDRYTIETHGTDPTEARRQAAAQILMLLAK
jgi:hypothetical protein